MNWLVLAIIPPFLWSLVNHADKYLLSKYVKSGVGGLMIFSTLIAVFVLPILYFINPGVLDLPLTALIVFPITGVLGAIAIFFYMHAMNRDEASIVIPFTQLIPIFTYVLGFIILKETLSVSQMLGGAITILGALILSFEITEENKFKIRKGTPLLMTCACLLMAFQAVIFKLFAFDESFVVSSFWVYVGLLIFGLGLLCKRSFRKDFLNLLKNSSKPIFTMSFFSEILTILGNLSYSYATLMVPVIFVALIYPFQPAFVFIEGILLTIFLPHIAEEKISTKHLAHKFSAIAVMFLGTYVLYFK